MKPILRTGLVLLSGFLFFIACSKDNEQDLNEENNGGNPGGNTCVTTDMKFAADIRPILEGNCYACHGNGQSEGGVRLDSYATVKALADNGKLVGVISHASGFPQMPQGGGKLPECTINKIKAWVEKGAPND